MFGASWSHRCLVCCHLPRWGEVDKRCLTAPIHSPPQLSPAETVSVLRPTAATSPHGRRSPQMAPPWAPPWSATPPAPSPAAAAHAACRLSGGNGPRAAAATTKPPRTPASAATATHRIRPPRLKPTPTPISAPAGDPPQQRPHERGTIMASRPASRPFNDHTAYPVISRPPPEPCRLRDVLDLVPVVEGVDWKD